jgi:hypothetical protein
MYDQLALLEEKAKRLQSDDPVLFTGIPVDPEVLRLEHEFKLSQRGGILSIRGRMTIAVEANFA